MTQFHRFFFFFFFFKAILILSTIDFVCRMTFKMYAVDFCELLLYDEQKQAYHMMLSTFQKKDALIAFIQ